MPFDPKLTYCLACTVGFAQGAKISSLLIAQSQYMKAAAVLKQDIELVARFHELIQDRAVEGRTAQMPCLPEEGRRSYGELNKIAHPSNFEEMHYLLSVPAGGFSISPIHNERIESVFYQVHLWNCVQISRAATELLGLLIDGRPHDPETEIGFEACMATFEHLFQKVRSIFP
jgi:hypothetical protein